MEPSEKFNKSIQGIVTGKGDADRRFLVTATMTAVYRIMKFDKNYREVISRMYDRLTTIDVKDEDLAK